MCMQATHTYVYAYVCTCSLTAAVYAKDSKRMYHSYAARMEAICALMPGRLSLTMPWVQWASPAGQLRFSC